jgi:hypothetical protein
MDMLKEGNVATIKVKNVLWPIRDRYAANVRIPEFNIYTGTIVRQKWYGVDEVGITSDQPHHPIRRLRRADVVSVNDTVVDYTPIKSERVEIVVKGSKGNTYIVTKENGKATCTCSGFQFRKTCKHSQEVLVA